MVLFIIPLLAIADSKKEYFNLRWDYDYPNQKVRVTHFNLITCVDMVKCEDHIIEGGDARTANNVFINKNINGVVTATVKACSRDINECSVDSNRVTFDREPPQPPNYIRYIPGVR